MNSETNDLKISWAAIQKASDDEYVAELRSLDPDGVGLKITCPDCKAVAWARLSEKRYAHNPISIACPAACGAYYPMESFTPSASTKADAGSFDMEFACRRDGAEFALNGAIFRCPVCGIENPREVMRSLTAKVHSMCLDDTRREDLVRMLGEVVSTFDGVMRRCNEIAVKNREVLNGTPISRVTSFQNVSAAKDRLLPEFDMASCVNDWAAVVRIFQKRHLFAHSLGVVDAEYIRKSGDQSVVIGKQVPLTSAEIVYLSESAESIVKKYFGYYLS